MADHPRAAVLLDADGTLVDSNYLHVDAWSRAFAEHGAAQPAWRIHRRIGMGGDKLVADLLGDRAEELGEQVSDAHSRHYLAMAERLRRFGGVPELLDALHRRGAVVVLSTSAAPDELDRLVEVLDVTDELHAVTAAQDVSEAKPAPDLVESGLQHAGVPADRAVFVGDSVWDVRASRRAGVRCVGVRSGGTGPAELLEEGALAVYDDVADLLAHLDTSPLAELWQG